MYNYIIVIKVIFAGTHAQTVLVIWILLIFPRD